MLSSPSAAPIEEGIRMASPKPAAAPVRTVSDAEQIERQVRARRLDDELQKEMAELQVRDPLSEREASLMGLCSSR
jgi:hypothetical protein